MAERRRNRRKQDADQLGPEDAKPAKIEYEIAKYLRSRLPQKQTTFHSHKVNYFIGSRAVDLLMSSKWAQADKKTDQTMFANRQAVVVFMETMLRHQFFHRAKTIIVTKEVKIKDSNETTEDTKKTPKNKLPSCKGSESEKSPNAKKTKVKKDKVEKKKKVKLGMHDVQMFVDENEPFVWLYDYIPMKTWLIGGALLLAAIAFCLFPLWPRSVRNGVYYLSIAAATFLFFIIGLALLKMLVFAVVWLATFGRHHFWLLPNLTEDVGFVESFWPLYKHQTKAGDGQDDNSEDKDDEEQDKKKTKDDASNVEGEKKSDSEAESVATTEKSNNGFEILDSNDCDEHDA